MGSNASPAPHHETPRFGNPDLPQEGMVNTNGDPASATMTGPRNPVLESQFPNVLTAPADRLASLFVQDPHDEGADGGHIVAAPGSTTGDWWYWFSWAERIAPVHAPGAAADAVISALQPRELS